MNCNLTEKQASIAEIITGVKSKNGVFHHLLKLSAINSIPDYHNKIDNVMKKIECGNFIVMGSLKDEPRTSYLLDILLNLTARNETSVAYLTSDSTSLDIVTKLICSESGYSERDFVENNNLDLSKVTKAAIDLSKKELFIDEMGALSSLSEIKKKIKHLVNEKDVKVFILDSLHTKYSGNNVKRSYGILADELNALAKELSICIIFGVHMDSHEELKEFNTAGTIVGVLESKVINKCNVDKAGTNSATIMQNKFIKVNP